MHLIVTMEKGLAMYKLTAGAALATIFAFAAYPSYANSMQKNMEQQVTSQGHPGRGMVNKVDIDAGKVNIGHETFESLKWPKMTMDFNVQDKSALAEIKPGMQVDFEIAKVADGYCITRIVPPKE